MQLIEPKAESISVHSMHCENEHGGSSAFGSLSFNLTAASALHGVTATSCRYTSNAMSVP